MSTDSKNQVPPEIELAWRMGVTIQARRWGESGPWLDVDTYEEFSGTYGYRLSAFAWEFRIKPVAPELDDGSQNGNKTRRELE